MSKVLVAFVLGSMTLATGRSARASGTAAQKCASTKIKAAGKKAACLLSLESLAANGRPLDPVRVQKCKDKLGDPTHGTFARADAKGGCLTPGDAPAVEAMVDALVDDVNTALNVGTPNSCQAAKLKAVGKKASCLLGLRAKEAGGRGIDTGKLQACKDRMASTFDKFEAGGACATIGDAATIETKVDDFVDNVVAAEPSVATCAIAGCPAVVACDTGVGACWHPPLHSRWQYQLEAALTASDDCKFPATGGIDVGITSGPFTGGGAVAPDVFDIDFLVDPACAPDNNTDNTAAVSAIHANGAKAICYLSAGTDEPFRPDHQQYVDFDAACGGCLFGNPVGGFQEEHWLDINDDQGQRTFILGRVAARLDRCRADGFDAVEFDNVEAYANNTGLPISESTQLVFNATLANMAHARGLTAALKNDLGQIGELLPYFDMAVNEQCEQFDECDALHPFVLAGKAVFQVEYELQASNLCPPANAGNRNASVKTVDLFDVPWTPCR